MTLHNTIRSFLITALEWAKRNRDYWEKIRDDRNYEFSNQLCFVEYRFNKFVDKLKGFFSRGIK